jgi:hypothetical protein
MKPSTGFAAAYLALSLLGHAGRKAMNVLGIARNMFYLLRK